VEEKNHGPKMVEVWKRSTIDSIGSRFGQEERLSRDMRRLQVVFGKERREKSGHARCLSIFGKENKYDVHDEEEKKDNDECEIYICLSERREMSQDHVVCSVHDCEEEKKPRKRFDWP
jgi:hypothetical protein